MVHLRPRSISVAVCGYPFGGVDRIDILRSGGTIARLRPTSRAKCVLGSLRGSTQLDGDIYFHFKCLYEINGGGDATAVQPSPLRTHCSTHNAARAPLPPSWAKNIGPKLFYQKRSVLWLISIPRSWSRSSTLRSESGNRMHIITAKRLTSGLVLKHLKGGTFGHPGRLTVHPGRLKGSSSDNTFMHVPPALPAGGSANPGPFPEPRRGAGWYIPLLARRRARPWVRVRPRCHVASPPPHRRWISR